MKRTKSPSNELETKNRHELMRGTEKFVCSYRNTHPHLINKDNARKCEGYSLITLMGYPLQVLLNVILSGINMKLEELEVEESRSKVQFVFLLETREALFNLQVPIKRTGDVNCDVPGIDGKNIKLISNLYLQEHEISQIFRVKK